MSGSQKFIARNRAPRVQIEYDVELYGAQKKVQLPFVMGVMSDLSGKSEKPSVDQRDFLEIDVDNFDDRMQAMAPKAQFSVPNTLTGDGNLSVDLTFEKMSDFSPEAIAEKTGALKPLLDARRQLTDLMTYMDGKSSAEALIENLLANPALLQALTATPGEATAELDSALESLKAAMPAEQPVADRTQDTLAALAASAPTDPVADTKMDDVLGGLEAPAQEDVVDEMAVALDALKAAPVALDVEQDVATDVLAGLAEAAQVHESVRDDTADVLSSLDRIEDVAEADATSDVLSGIERTKPSEEIDTIADVLNSIEAVAEGEDDTSVDDALASIEAVPEPTDDVDQTDDILGSLEPVPETTLSGPDAGDILATIHTQTPDQDVPDTTLDVLASIDTTIPGPETEDTTDDVLAAIDAPAATAKEGDDFNDVLSSIDTVTSDVPPEDNIAEDILGRLEPVVEDKAEDTALIDALSSIDTSDPVVSEEDSADDILAGVDAIETKDTSDVLEGVLSSIDVSASEAKPDDNTDGILGGIDTVSEENTLEDALDDLDDILGSLEESVEEDPAEANVNDVLSGLDTAPDTEDSDDDLDALLAGIDTEAADEPVEEESLDSILADLEVPQGQETLARSGADDVLAVLDNVADSSEGADNLDDLLASLDPVALGDEEDNTDDILNALDTDNDKAPSGDEDLDALLADLSDVSEPDALAEVDPLDDLLADLEAPTETQSAADLETPDDDLDALLADLETPEEPVAAADDSDNELDALLAELDKNDDADTEPQDEVDEDDLDALLVGLETETPDETSVEDATEDDLDALLADLGGDDEPAEDAGDDDLDALLAGLSDDVPMAATDDDLDSLLDELGGDDAAENSAAKETPVTEGPKQSPFGLISVPRPARDELTRGKFRMAVFGDFTGRAARGAMDTGDALAARKPIELDVDTIDDIVEGFATTLTLPIGKDGAGIEISLKEMDDLHPDELYEKVGIFEAISGLRQQLSVGSMAAKATEKLQAWSEEFGTPIKIPKRSAGTSVPANLKLSDFQALIGDTSGSLIKATPADELIAQVVGPHIVKAPDAGAEAMKAAVDEALSAAMRMVLHHPDFQAVESQWRSLDMLARRVETDSDLQIVLYDVSAEEIAADLAAQEDLAESGLFKLLTRVLDPEEGAGGFSALFGMYTFEETPTHAELLARIAQLGAHVDAPFFAGISPGYLDVAKEDRHPLTAKSWDTLREMPEAAYLGLGAPRFLIRQPYGAKSEPIYEFEFEEFTPQEGLSGMLWANPAVLTAILLAGTYKKDGKAMSLGSMMSLGDMPFYYVNDRYGDQVALPCTERNLTSDPVQTTLARGFMPVVWVKGRNEVRLGSFRALSGDEIAGPWSGETPPARMPGSAPSANIEMNLEIEDEQGEDPAEESLDDLLAGFDDDDSDEDLDGDMDPELAALLEGL